MPAMNGLVLAALIVFAVATVGGLIFAAVQGFGAWRAFRGFKRAAEPLFAVIGTEAAGMEARTAAMSRRVDEFERAREQLERTLAEARVAAEAGSEAAAFFKRVRGFMPSK
jgi:hypothetical protein